MKKTLAAFLLALTLLTGGASAFSDVDEGLYYAAPTAWAVERGITTGTSADTFSPDALCTQGQILTFLWRAAGSPASSAPCSFTDVAPGAGYAQAVAWAVETGITFGTSEATFSPGEPCTRGQIATFLYRCLNEAASGEKVTVPEKPASQPPAPEPAEEARPLRTYTGTGEAHSLGLDGSEFTSEGVYEAQASVEIYSPYEAVFTVKVPFPLFQASTYTVRFHNPERPDKAYLFTFFRWDEAFADMIPWEGGHNRLRFTDTGDPDSALSIQQDYSGDDRIGGVLVRRLTISRDSGFSFAMLEGCTLSCEVGASV